MPVVQRVVQGGIRQRDQSREPGVRGPVQLGTLVPDSPHGGDLVRHRRPGRHPAGQRSHPLQLQRGPRQLRLGEGKSRLVESGPQPGLGGLDPEEGSREVEQDGSHTTILRACVPLDGELAPAEHADEIRLAHDRPLSALLAAPEHHLVREPAGVLDAGPVERGPDRLPRIEVRAVAGGVVGDLVDRPAAGGPGNPISPAADTSAPPAQATCSLLRGASRSRPSRATTKVKGSEVSAGPRPDSQASRSAGERMIRPSLSGRTVERSSGGPT